MDIANAIKRIVEELDGEETFTFAQAKAWAKEYGFSVERPSAIIQGLAQAHPHGGADMRTYFITVRRPHQ
jgi:hypothetical protein